MLTVAKASFLPTSMTMSSEEAQEILEKRLQEALSTRETTEASAKLTQKDLGRLFGQKGPSRPRETIDEINQQIEKLELHRTINSMSLQEERQILKQIYKLQVLRRQVEAYQEYDNTIKSKKHEMGQLRANLRVQRLGISEIKTELSTVSKAASLGCNVTELLGKKVECPKDKLGNVIGKQGKNVKELMRRVNVDIDIEKKEGDIRILGTLDSLDEAASSIDKIVSQTEETVELPRHTHRYLTSAKITAIADLRSRHPDVYLNVNRESNDDNNNDARKIRVRGAPTDIEKFRDDVDNMELVIIEMKLTSREAGLLVGKGGGTVGKLVKDHQVAVEVHRPEEEVVSEDEKSNRVTLIGPINNVASIRTVIEDMLEEAKDREECIPVNTNTKTVLLLNSGAGIQSLHTKVNEATKQLTDLSTTYVAVNFKDRGISVRGKRKALEVARPIVQDELSKIDSLQVKVQVDPVAIPNIIGKGGKRIQKLTEGTTKVSIELDRDAGIVFVCGTDKEEVDNVVSNVEAVKAENQVQRIRLECDDTNNFSVQFRNFLRSAASKEVRALAFVTADDDMKQIVLRGKAENISKAAAIVEEFVALNFLAELCVTEEDFTALLTGGKKSKIVELAANADVKLNTERDRQVVVAKGAKDKVANALKLVKEFLYGSDDVAVCKITLENDDLMGVVIGRGGKTKDELQQKFSAVSMLTHRNEAAITLRGPSKGVEDCHVEILKLLSNATITRTTELSKSQLKFINKTKFNRFVVKAVPVQVVVKNEKSTIAFRGNSLDVQEANALLREQLHGVYESRIKVGSHQLFERLTETCQNPSHLDRIRKESQAEVSLDEKTEEVVLSGKRANVTKAKHSLWTFFDFLFGPNICRCESTVHMLSKVARPAALAEISARTGTHVVIDRDLNSILIFSTDSEKVKEAASLLKAKLAEGEDLCYTMQLDRTEDWLVSSIIGKGGANVKKLRKQTGCNIDVDSKERRVVLSANDPETLTKGRDFLNSFVDTSRKTCLFVAIPQSDTPAFVGRAGSHISAFSEKHAVEVQILKNNQESSIRITGDEENVATAKIAMQEWLAQREKHNAEADATRQLRPDQVPVLIGAKGSTIDALTKEFGCKIDVNRKSSVVAVRGGSAEKRTALLAKIDQLISDEGKDADDEASLGDTRKLEEDQVPKLIGPKGATINALTKEFGCRIDIDRKTCLVKIRDGSEEKRAALLAKIDLIILEEGTSSNSRDSAEETKQLEEDQIPRLIGPKGATINALTKEFGCRIDIDRETHVVTIRGAKRAALLAKIDMIVSGDGNFDGHTAPLLPHSTSASNETRQYEQNHDRQKRNERSKKPETAKGRPSPQHQKVDNTGTVPEEDFPSLLISDSKEATPPPLTSKTTSPWAAIVVSDRAAKDVSMESMDEKSSMSSTAFVGDVIEAESELAYSVFEKMD